MNKPVISPIHTQPVSTHRLRNINSNTSVNTFSKHFQSALQTTSKLTISKHANERLQQRGIHINDQVWQRIEEKVQQAKNLGVKNSLVLLENAALIISAKNHTVITAMDRQEATTQIFTNINGTIVL